MSNLTNTKTALQNIQERAVLVSLTLKKWSPTITDKAVTAEVTTAKSAVSDAGNFRKRRLAKSATAAIDKADSDLRNWFRRETQPWSDGGMRMKAVAQLDEFLAESRKKIEARERAVQDFTNRYLDEIEFWKPQAGDLFSQDDYPELEAVKDSFTASIDVVPVPDGKDFRVTIDRDSADKIKAQFESQCARNIADSKKELINRILAPVAKIVASLKADEGKVHGKTISTMASIGEVLEEMNVYGDPAITQLQKDLVEAGEEGKKDKGSDAFTSKMNEISSKLSQF